MFLDNSRMEFHCTLWFKDESTYLAFQKVCPDMRSPYHEWLQRATEQLRQLSLHGINLNKVEADANEFAVWCKINSRPTDGASRSVYAPIKFHETRKISEN